MRKKISLLLVAALCCSTILAGCSKSESTGTQGSSAQQESTVAEGTEQVASETQGEEAALDTSEFVKLYGYLLGSPEPAFNDVMAEMNKMLKEDLNCEMEINFIDWSVLDSKYPLLLAAGEEIDWIYTADWCHYAAEANKNAFMEIDMDMVKQCMPLYSEYITDAAWDQVSLNGKIYMIPTSTPDVKAGGWIVRKDLADKYGVDLSKVETIWDMDEYLGAIKENEPSMIPMNMDNSYDLLAPVFALMTARDANFTDANKCGLVYAFDGKETADGVYSIFDEPVYGYLKEAAVKMKEWYDAGYINKDILAATTQSNDNFEQGISGISSDNTLGMQRTLAKCAENGWTPQIVLTDDANGHAAKNSYTNNGFAIAATCQNPERTLAAMDLIMNDPRYNTLLQYGIEGETYIINEEGKVDYPEGVTADTTSYNWENTGFWFINKNIQLPRASWTDDYIELNNKLIDGVLIDDPNIGFTFTTDSVKSEFSNVQNVWIQYFYPIAIGNVPDVDKALEELKVQLTAAGYDKLIEEAKRQYAEYTAN